jgi:hypothetical protein
VVFEEVELLSLTGYLRQSLGVPIVEWNSRLISLSSQAILTVEEE